MNLNRLWHNSKLTQLILFFPQMFPKNPPVFSSDSHVLYLYDHLSVFYCCFIHLQLSHCYFTFCNCPIQKHKKPTLCKHPQNFLRTIWPWGKWKINPKIGSAETLQLLCMCAVSSGHYIRPNLRFIFYFTKNPKSAQNCLKWRKS